jgi:NAD(P)H-dependent flavin oxidoreductase YrpB (nitropropane dioxygenase family)
MGALTDFNEHVQTALEESVDIIFLGAGLPLKNPTSFSIEALKKMSTKIVPKVSSARAVELIFKYWSKNHNCIPDAVVIEGPLAGGHLGFKEEQINDSNFALEKLVPEVVAVLKQFEQQFSKEVPVIAAGGIYTGADIYKFLELGAKGVKMGTRFVATHECDAAMEFKQAYVSCKKEDITIIKSPVGLPGRAINSQFIEEVRASMKKPFKCRWKCLKTCNVQSAPYCIAQALISAKNGDLVNGFAFAGANAYRIEKIMSVKKLIRDLVCA